jgi:putative endonuclease
MDDAWVYMLRCRDDSLYTGWTNDLDKRLARHVDGKASRYTASRLPVELAAAWQMPDRSAAMREERRIKALSRSEKFALLATSDRQAPAPALAGRSSASTAPSGGSSSPSSPNSDGSR